MQKKHSVIKILNKKHYRPDGQYDTKLTFVFAFISTFLIVQFFPFFEIDYADLKSRLFISLITAILVCISILVNYHIFQPNKSPWLNKDELKYNLSIFTSIFLFINLFAMFLLNISLKHIVNTPYRFSYSPNFTVKSFLYTIIFGVSVYIFINFYDLLKFIFNKTKLNLELAKDSNEILDLKGKNKNERLVIPVSDLIYMKSEGHYVSIFYTLLDKQKLNNIIFRLSMNDIESKLKPYDTIIRCHKSYFINSEHIKTTNYHGKKFYAVVNGFNKRIPVTIDKVDLLNKKITNKF